MISTRIWVFLLVLLAVGGVGAALLTQGVVQRQIDGELNEALERDQFELDLVLKLDARSRIDDLAALAANEDIRAVLRSVREHREDAAMRDANMRAKSKLSDLNRQLQAAAGDLVFLLDGNGVIVAQLGPNEARFGASLATFPLVERALAGYLRDDVWVYDNTVYRMAARPVIDGGAFIGAIISGKKLDERFAEVLSTRLSGASVAFYRDATLIAAHAPTTNPPAPSGPEMATQLTTLREDEAYGRGESSGSKSLQEKALVVYVKTIGDAAEAGVGYAIARSRRVIASPKDLFGLVTKDDMQHAQVPLLAIAGFILFALAMALSWFDHDAPLRTLRGGAEAIANGSREHIDAGALKGAHRKIAILVNQALDRAIENAGPPKTNLDALLGAPPASNDSTGQDAFFAFSEMPLANNSSPAPSGDPPIETSKPPLPATSKPPTQLTPSLPAPMPRSMPTPSGFVPSTPPPLPRSMSPMAATIADADQTAPNDSVVQQDVSVQRAPIPVQSVRAGRSADAQLTTSEKDLRMPQTPRVPVMTKPAPAPPLLSTPPHLADIKAQLAAQDAREAQEAQQAEDALAGSDEVAGESTMVAHPEELPFGSTAGAVNSPVTAASAAPSAQEAHFRSVFDDYIASKKGNGESVAGLTFEKFEVTLRDQYAKIMQDHEATDVRFTVYIKEGKTKLRATPIK